MDNSHFRRLAPELRNQIHELVLYEPGGFELVSSRLYYNTKDEKGLTTPDNVKPRARFTIALTSTCREIRNDTLVMFYAINDFHLLWPLQTAQAVGRWSPDCKDRYTLTLKACREWLKGMLPHEAANAIAKLSVKFAGGNTWELGKRPTYWWNDARKLEKEILHSAMKPSSIFIDFSMICYDEEDHPLGWAPVHPFTGGPFLYTCHKDILNTCKMVKYQLPANDKTLGQAEVERAARAQHEMIDESAKQYPCCVGVLQKELLDGLETSRSVLLKAIWK